MRKHQKEEVAPLVPLPDSPVTKYGLTWIGVHDPVEFTDHWSTRHNGVDYLIIDLGYRALLAITQDGKQTGHRFINMESAALGASQHSKVKHF